MKRALLPVLLLAACDRPAPVPPPAAGVALEREARARGLVADPSALDPVGVYAGETDRACIVPAPGGYRIGAAVDYGEGQGCLARGTASRTERGGALAVRLDETCRFNVAFDGDRIRFPPTLPVGCDHACRGRASLSTFAADRLSASQAEARSMPAPDGMPLCG